MVAAAVPRLALMLLTRLPSEHILQCGLTTAAAAAAAAAAVLLFTQSYTSTAERCQPTRLRHASRGTEHAWLLHMPVPAQPDVSQRSFAMQHKRTIQPNNRRTTS
jgi:hypothetical protein